MTKLDGFVPMYRDSSEGSLYLEIGRFDEDLLYQISRSSRPRASMNSR